MGKFLNPWVDPRVERVHPHQIEKYVLGHRWTARESGYSTVRVFEPPYRAEYYPILSIWQDLTDPGPIRMMDYWTCFSKSGINGDPTLATAEKGKIIFESVVTNFVKFAREFKNRPRGERTDNH